MVATTLRAGQVAIVGYNSEDTNSPLKDTISFILLNPIGSGTQIFFTDRAWNGTTFAAAGGGDGTFTYTAGADLPAGTVIQITTAQLNAAGIDLADTGETIYVYQGTNANTPTSFLFAADIADGNNTFNGSLANTGLSVAANTAVAISFDNASFAARGHDIQTPVLLDSIADSNDWVGNDNSLQVAPTGSLFNAPDQEIWVAASGGGNALVRLDRDGASFSAEDIIHILQNSSNDGDGTTFTQRVWHPTDIIFDTVHNKLFVADSDGSGHNRIVQFNISDFLANPGVAPTGTILYHDASVSVGMVGIQLDMTNSLVYYAEDTHIYRLDYNTAAQTPEIVVHLGTNVFVQDFVLDLDVNGNGTAYLVNSAIQSVFGTDNITRNFLYSATGITPTSTTPAATANATQMEMEDNDTDIGGVASTNADPQAFPKEYGNIKGIDLDPVTHILYFTTGTWSADHDNNSGTPPVTEYGGIWSYATISNAIGHYASVFRQDGINGPDGIIYYLEVDHATGKYYVGDITGGPGAAIDDQDVWVGNIAGGTPTQFAVVANIQGLSPLGISIQTAPTLTGTNVNPGQTEQANSPSPNGDSPNPPVVTPANTFTTSDLDTIGAASGDNLAGAQVRVSSNFLSNAVVGDDHQDILSISSPTTGTTTNGTVVLGGDTIAFVYDSTTGVMTFSGISTFANYQTVLAMVRFQATGDNPTNFGAAGTRTISYATFDGLLYSDEVNATVTITGLNDTPVNTVGGTATFNEDSSANAIAGISVFDVDADPANQDIVVSFTVAHGTLNISTAVVNGITVSDITGGANGSNTITVTATQNQINATLAASGLTYTPTGNYNGADALTVVTNDQGLNGLDPGLTGNGTSETDSDNKTINITAINDAPTVINGTTEASTTILEDTPLAAGQSVTSLFSTHFSDVLDQQQTGGNPTGSVANTFAGIAVTANGSSGATGQWQYSTNGGGSWQDIGAVADATARLYAPGTLLRFNPTLNYNGAEPTLTVHLIDSSLGAVSDNALANLVGATGGTTRYSGGTVDLGGTITAVNDPPVDTVPGAQGINEDGSRVFNTANGNAISVSDVDVGASSLKVTLSVLHGTLTLNGIVGLDFTGGVGDGTADATMTFTGTQAAINAALQGLTYNPTADYNGADTLTITTNDQGNTGLDPGLSGDGTSEQDSDTVTINIAPVVDIAGDAVTVGEDSGGNALNGIGNPVSLFTNDSFENAGRFISAVTQGLHGSVTISDNGTAGNATDDYVVYTPNADYYGSDSFQYTVTSGGVTETATVNVTVTAVADIVDDTGSGNEDTPINVFVLVNDTFEATPAITGTTNGLHGTVAVNDAGTPLDTTDDYVVYTPALNYNGADSFTYTVTSGGVTETATVQITNVAAVNDAPVNTVPGAQTVAEDGSLSFTGGTAISVADVDLGAGNLTVTLSVLHGTLTLSGIGGLTFAPASGDGTADATMTFSGTQAAINTALNGLSYSPTTNYNGPDTLTITTKDNGNTGIDPGGDPSSEQDIDTVAINVTAVNDTPALVVATPLASTEQVFATIDAAASVHDVDLDALNGGSGDYGGSTLTVVRQTGANADDLFQFAASGSFTVNGGSLEAPGSLVFASFTNSGGTLTISFNDSGTTATTALVNAVLEAIQYANNNDTPPASIDLTVSLNDGAPANAGQGDVTGHPATGTATVHVNITDTAENQAPVIDLDGGGGSIDNTANYTENNGPVILASGVTVSDADDTNIESATVSVGSGFHSGFDYLEVNGGTTGSIGAISFNYVAATGILTLSGSDTLANYQAALAQVGFESTSDTPGTSRAISWTINDGTTTSTAATTTVTITELNDAPSGTDNTITINEDSGGRVLTAADFGFSDVEGNSFAGVVVTTTPGAGILIYDPDGPGGLPGVLCPPGQFVSAAQLALGALTYSAGSDNNGSPFASFTFQVRDNGATGGGEQNTDQSPNTITFNVTPVNDAPVVDLNGAGAGTSAILSYTENDPATAIAPSATVTDIDTTNYNSGHLLVQMTNGINAEDVLSILNQGTGPGQIGYSSGVITYQGTAIADLLPSFLSPIPVLDIAFRSGTIAPAAVQALVEAIGYNNLSDNPTLTARTVTYTLTDGDGTANGGADTGVATATINIAATDDPGVAKNDAVTTDEATILSGNVIVNNGSGPDSDPDNAPTVASVNGSAGAVGNQFTLGSGALLTLNSNGTFSYDPNHRFDTTPTPGSGASNTPALDSFSYTLTGGSAATVTVTITGLDTNDILLGTAGADVLVAGVGNDILNGLAGADSMSGGTGDDTYFVDSSGDNVSEAAAAGRDVVYASATFALAAGSEVEVLSTAALGGASPINLFGNALAQEIYGNAGANVLRGGGGADVLMGLGGDDEYWVTAPETVIEASGMGRDVVYAGANYILASGSHVEVLSAVSLIDTTPLSLAGNELAQEILGNAGANVLRGGGGADVLVGLGGDDEYWVTDSAARVVEAAGQGRDVVYASVDYTLEAGSHVEVLSAVSLIGATPLNLTGNELGQEILGNAAANVLDGKGGSDVLFGDGGADIFAFTTALGAGNVDTIADMVAGTDKIALDDAVFSGLALGALNPNAFAVGAAQDANDRIIYDQSIGALYYDADGNGAGAAVLFAVLQGHPVLTASDFTVI